MNAKIVEHHGVKKISIHDELYEPLAFRSFRPEARNISEFYEAGIRLMSVLSTGLDCTLDVPYSPHGEIWDGIGRYNFENLDTQMQLFIQNAPDAYFNLMLQLDTRDWYLAENAECSNTFRNLVEMAGYTKWRDDAAKYLTDVLHYIEDNYGDRVFAYSLFCGGSTEWYTNSQGHGKPETEIRFHPVKERCFAQWTGNPDAKLPGTEALYHTTNGVLRDPVADARALEYWHFHHEIIGETICHFADIAKKATDRQKLIGVYYGYLNTLGGSRLLHEGHLGYENVWNSPDIDMILSPAKYGEPRSVAGASGYLTTVDSIGLRGKLNFQEIDHTTYIAPETVENGRLIPGSNSKLTDEYSTRMVLRREFILTRVKRTALWWFDFFGGYYYSKPLMDEVRRMLEVGERLTDIPMRSVAEIAVFGDIGSAYYPSIYSALADDLLVSPPDEFARVGAPFDIYNLSDLGHAESEHNSLKGQYKLYVFLNALELADEQRKIIDDQLLASGKSVLWIYAPGYIGPDGFSVDRISELTGIKTCEYDSVDGTAFPTRDDIFSYIDSVEPFGFSRRIFPLFEIVDDDVAALARYHADGSGGVALARKQHKAGGTVYYSTVGNIPSRLLREIARNAGVHIYYDGDDPVYINSRLLGIHQQSTGPHRISIPAAADVDAVAKTGAEASRSFEFTELFGGTDLSSRDGVVTVPDDGDCVKFYLCNRDMS